MFGGNYFQEAIEGYDQGFSQNDMLGFFFPPFEGLSNDMVPKDFIPLSAYPDFEGPEHTQLMQMLDQNFQYLPEEFRQFLHYPLDCMIPQAAEISQVLLNPIMKKQALLSPQSKIGSITLEERRIKVQRFLEKRKTRNFKKKISYMCRKKVADNRVRIKGRFVSKTEAEKILGEQS